MSDLRPIETRYRGYRFRSRLEARWAVFLDSLGVKFEYENQGFDLGSEGPYLPDFWLPVQECWLEIKGVWPPVSEQKKCAALAQQSRKCVFLFTGSDFAKPDVGDPMRGMWSHVFWPERYDEEGDFSSGWGECIQCMDRVPFFGIGDEGVSAWMEHARDAHGGHIPLQINYGSPRLLAAYVAARAARFEFER
jgi:hypothetical protein